MPANVHATSSGTLIGSSSVTLPTRSSGDILVVYVGSTALPPTANTGWIEQWNQANDDSSFYLAVYTKVSDGTDSTPLGSSVITGGYIAYSVQSATAVDGSTGAGDGTAGTNIVAPSISPTGTTDLLISAYFGPTGSGTITVPAGQTQVGPLSISTARLNTGYESLSASGATGTRTASNTVSSKWIAGNTAVSSAATITTPMFSRFIGGM